MIRPHGYAREKLLAAVEKLAVCEEDVRQRLRIAYRILRVLEESHFPEDKREDWRWVNKQMTRYGPTVSPRGEVWEGAVDATMRRIRNNTGKKIAKKIFDLHWTLDRRALIEESRK